MAEEASHDRTAVRLATTRDLPRLTILFDAYRQFYGLESNTEGAAEFLSARLARGESVVLVATISGSATGGEEIVGFAQLYPTFSSLSLGSVIVLNDLFVEPKARRLGAGGRLLDAAIEYAQGAGALRLTLETHPDNEAAKRLYRAKGFVVDSSDFTEMSITFGTG